MARRKPAPPPHKAAPHRPVSVCLFALPQGGFLVRDPMWAQDYRDMVGNMVRTHDDAAFSTLEEALEWLRVNMARPAQEPTPA